MTQISRYYLSKSVLNHIFDMFLSLIAKVKNKKSADNFFQDFFSSTERIMFAKRLAIGILLAKKYEYRKISRTLNVSTATIGRFSELYKQSATYKEFVNTILLSEEIQNFLLDLGHGLASISDIGGAKSAGWRKLKIEIHKNRLERDI